jgi:pyruvate,water dikinase
MTAPTDFPIPSDLQGFHFWDKMHCPRPQTALTQDLFNKAISQGFTGGMDEFACPVGVTYVNVNRYAYITLGPQPLGSETIEERVERYKGHLGHVLPNMRKLWEEEWLPSILPGIKSAMERDYTALNDQELVSTLEQMQQDFVARYVIHGKINFVIASAGLFVDFYNELMDPEDATEAYETQGYPTLSLDAGTALWELGRIVNKSSELSQSFERNQPGQLMIELESSDIGRSFLQAFKGYLDDWGWRSEAFELADTTWREDPTVPLNAIQGYMRLDDSENPENKYQQAIKRREELMVAARAAVAGDTERSGALEALYAQAESFATITENHNFYIDQRGNSVMRLPILEIGARLVSHGRTAEINDVFHLDFDEIKAAFSGTDQNSLVSERKSELEKWAKIVPVPTIGEPPDPEESAGDPLGMGFAKFFGVPPEPSRDPDIIQGLGASPGVIQGTAKVVRTLAEASKLEKGDIMVCEMTMPPWTPLFSIAGAVVADTGGPLSHCAIVSREYKMPCVVGTLFGTAVITDGMTLTVDGAKGIVRIDSRG